MGNSLSSIKNINFEDMLSFIEKKKKGRFFPNLSGRRRNKYQFGRAFTPGSENVYIYIYLPLLIGSLLSPYDGNMYQM